MENARKPYPSDVSDDEWAFLVVYLTLMREDALQREYPLRELFNALKYVVRTGCQWRMLPHDFPPWPAVYQQARRWLQAGVFNDIAHDLRIAARELADRNPQPSAAIIDARTLQSTPESGGRAGYDGNKKKNGSKIHIAVDTLGNLLTLVVTPANEQDRALAGQLTKQLKEETGEHVRLVYTDQGYIGENPKNAAKENGIELEIVKHTEAKKGFVLLPRRWVVERTFGWLGRFRRLARDYERLDSTLASWHWVAMIALLLPKIIGKSA